MKPRLNKHAGTSARIYADGLLEFCERQDVKALVLLVEADEALEDKRLDPEELGEIHFLIGWLTGCAEAQGMSIEAFWAILVPPATAKTTKAPRRAAKKAA